MKKTILILLTALCLTALLGCTSSKTSTTANKATSGSAPLSYDELSSIIAEIATDDDIILPPEDVTAAQEQEETKEIKTKSAATDELVAEVLKAFCEKDAKTYDVLVASCTGKNYGVDYYSSTYNDFCKAADNAGLDWKNLTSVPSDWVIYMLDYPLVDYIWVEMYYPPLKESFGIHIGINEFDYNTETYSFLYIKANKGKSAKYFDAYEKYADTGEKAENVGAIIYRVDIKDYLD